MAALKPLPNKPTPAQVREYLFDRYAGFNGKITTNVAFDIELELGTFIILRRGDPFIQVGEEAPPPIFPLVSS